MIPSPKPFITLLLLLGLSAIASAQGPDRPANTTTVRVVSTAVATATTTTPLLTPSTTPTPPADLKRFTSNLLLTTGGNPFINVQSMMLQNNWLIVQGPTTPNFQNVTKKQGPGPYFDETWMARTNLTGSFILSWSASNFSLLDFPNATLASNPQRNFSTSAVGSVYKYLSGKRSALQVPENMYFLLNSATNTIDVLSYGWLGPLDTGSKLYPPRSVPLPSNETANTIQMMSALDNNFGVFAVASESPTSGRSRLYWIPISEPYSPAAPLWATPTGPPLGNPRTTTTTTPPPARPTGNTTTPTPPSNSTVLTQLTPVWNQNTPLLYTCQGTVTALWLKQDFTSLFIAEHLPSPPNTTTSTSLFGPQTRILRLPVQGPNRLPAQSQPNLEPLLTLNLTTYPLTNPNTSLPFVTSLTVHPQSSELYIAFPAPLPASSSGTSEPQPAFVAVYTAAGVLKALIQSNQMSVISSLEIDAEGKFLYMGGKHLSEDRAGLEIFEIPKGGVASGGGLKLGTRLKTVEDITVIISEKKKENE
ncbi:hypothetical protein HDV05_008150 [Chytridiales sp. JEL 0842]|nr:hypothetical protein HDV05_008150 [Chytridiales sp. JEL 0842]